MRRPPAATLLTWLVYAALAVVVVFAFIIQQDRIARGNDRYDNLFAAYQELTRDCDQADDCYSDAPRPAEVAEALPGAPGATGATGSQGPRGFDGSDGEDGIDGASGVDGAPGASGPPGTDGADGAPGAPGAPGAAGSDGQPPVSWTFEYLGSTFTCIRTDPFDATAPTYTCN